MLIRLAGPLIVLGIVIRKLPFSIYLAFSFRVYKESMIGIFIKESNIHCLNFIGSLYPTLTVKNTVAY